MRATQFTFPFIIAFFFAKMTCFGSTAHQREVRKIKFDKSIEASLSDAITALKDRYGLAITIDPTLTTSNLDGNNAKAIHERPVQLRKLNASVSTDLLVEMLAQQVGGKSRWNRESNIFVIVPGRRSLATVLPPPSEQLLKSFAQPIELRNPIDAVPLRDVTEFLEDRFEVTILVERVLFPQINGKQVTDVSVRLPAGKYSIKDAVQSLAKQVRGEVVLRDNIILISYPPKEKS